MLIHALCEYYDILAKAGKVLPDGYSNVKIHYLVALTADGKIDEIINYQRRVIVETGKGKKKEKLSPKELVMLQRTQKSGIEANIVEHRPLYLFGLNSVGENLTPEDRTEKARKSHAACVEKNLAFLEGLDSPLIHAYREFLLRWKPEEETQNAWLLGLGKAYDKSGYVFCLSGHPELLLHEDEEIKKRWEQVRKSAGEEGDKPVISQCAISGEPEPIARIHNKIKGVPGGLATGNVLVSYKNPSESSYGVEQSYNSNISERAMRKYTETLNYLLGNPRHRVVLDDLAVVFWAMNDRETCEDLFLEMLFGRRESLNAGQTEDMLKNLLRDAKEGTLTMQRLNGIEKIDPEVDFYIVGMKPNSSRLSIKFIYRKKFGQIFENIARHQLDMQILEDPYPVTLGEIKKNLVSPKSTNGKPNPGVVAKLLEAVFYGTPYPTPLLETMVRRVRTDGDMSIHKNPREYRVRMGAIRACINRNARRSEKKEELKVALDKENQNQAYLCGRLFATLEKLQRDAAGTKLNRTIKDAYFASASVNPVLVFPKLLALAQNHMDKKNQKFYSILIGEILDGMEGKFPGNLSLEDQGSFMIGYYQQNQELYKSKEQKKEEETEENEDGN